MPFGATYVPASLSTSDQSTSSSTIFLGVSVVLRSSRGHHHLLPRTSSLIVSRLEEVSSLGLEAASSMFTSTAFLGINFFPISILSRSQIEEISHLTRIPPLTLPPHPHLLSYSPSLFSGNSRMASILPTRPNRSLLSFNRRRNRKTRDFRI